MIQNSLTPLPFYSSAPTKQERKQVCPIYSPCNTFIPFQLRTSSTVATAITAELYDDSNTRVMVLPTLPPYLKTVVDSVDGKVVILFNGVDLGLNLTVGVRYIKITMSGISYYSDLITVVDDIDSFLKLEWSSASNLVTPKGTIFSDTGSYKNIVYLQTTVSNPDYEFSEIASKREGYYFIEKQTSHKVFNFVATVTEETCDAINFARLADFVKVTSNGKTYTVNDLQVEMEWQEQGYVASITCKFKTNTLAKRIGENGLWWSPTNITGSNLPTNNTFSVLPFFASTDEQNRERCACVIAPLNHAPTFQLVVPYNPNAVVNVYIYGGNDEYIGDYTTQFIYAFLTRKAFPSTSLTTIYFPDFQAIADDLTEGDYYLKLTVDDKSYYSGIFKMVKSLVGDGYGYTAIRWTMDDDLFTSEGIFVGAESNIVNTLYTCEQLAYPEYELETVGDTIDGQYKPVTRTLQKIYHLNIVANEQLCDALRFMLLSDNIEVWDGETWHKAIHAKWTSQWLDDGQTAKVTFDFEFDFVAKKNGKYEGVLSNILTTESGENLITDYSPAHGESGLEIEI